MGNKSGIVYVFFGIFGKNKVKSIRMLQQVAKLCCFECGRGNIS